MPPRTRCTSWARTAASSAVNPAPAAGSGWSREELLTMGVTDIDPLVGLEQLRAMREEVAQAGHRVESGHCTRDGERFPVEDRRDRDAVRRRPVQLRDRARHQRRRAAETQLRLYAEVFEHAAGRS